MRKSCAIRLILSSPRGNLVHKKLNLWGPGIPRGNWHPRGFRFSSGLVCFSLNSSPVGRRHVLKPQRTPRNTFFLPACSRHANICPVMAHSKRGLSVCVLFWYCVRRVLYGTSSWVGKSAEYCPEPPPLAFKLRLKQPLRSITHTWYGGGPRAFGVAN